MGKLDFVGLNKYVYDPQSDDFGAFGDENTLGYLKPQYYGITIQFRANNIDDADTFTITQVSESGASSKSVTFEFDHTGGAGAITSGNVRLFMGVTGTLTFQDVADLGNTICREIENNFTDIKCTAVLLTTEIHGSGKTGMFYVEVRNFNTSMPILQFSTTADTDEITHQPALDRRPSRYRKIHIAGQPLTSYNYHQDLLNHKSAEYGGSNRAIDDILIAGFGGHCVGFISQSLSGIYHEGASEFNSTTETGTRPLPTLEKEADILNALNLHRNGPYQYPSWKQIRGFEHPIIRRHRENNIFTLVTEGEMKSLKIPSRLTRASSILKGSSRHIKVFNKYSPIKSFVEPPLSAKFKPLVYSMGMVDFSGLTSRLSVVRPPVRTVKIKKTYQNNINYFSNEKFNNELRILSCNDPMYEELKVLYLNGGIEDPSSPVDSFNYLTYNEVVFPKAENTFLAKTRGREAFDDSTVGGYWRTNRDVRSPYLPSASFHEATFPRQSVWPLDGRIGFSTESSYELSNRGNVDAIGVFHLATAWSQNSSTTQLVGNARTQGILQNNFSQANDGVKGNESMRLAPLYNRKHALYYKMSSYNPSLPVSHSMKEELQATNILFGTAKWEAPETRCILKEDGTYEKSARYPFFDSYDHYHESTRNRAKGFSVIPEFRISQNIEKYYNAGFFKKNQDIFSIHGALTSLDDSSETKFYRTYSTTDFLKNFKVLREDHKNLSDPSAITLRCSAMMKLLPYEGFYPCQRTVQLAEQWVNSYSSSLGARTSTITDARATIEGQYGKNMWMRPVFQPLFHPGVLFNTIKSGIAVDYPVITANGGYDIWPQSIGPLPAALVDAADTLVNYGIKTDRFDYRVPFESLIEPENYIKDIDFVDNEPHPNCEIGDVTSSFAGDGDPFYKIMSNNFLHEVADFFLNDGKFTSITSLPETHPDFGNVVSGSVYAMRVKIRRSTNIKTPVSGSNKYLLPQDLSHDYHNLHETFTMYSRPTAFGPASFSDITSSTFISVDRDAPHGIKDGRSDNGENGHSWYQDIYDSRNGYNFPFTPPYYHGEAWADIIFHASSSKKCTLKEIFDDCEVKYWRVADAQKYYNNHESPAVISQYYGPQGPYRVNKNAMQISASLNIFGRGRSYPRSEEVRSDGTEITKVDFDDSKISNSWVIETKFETPILNFGHLVTQVSDSFTAGGIPQGYTQTNLNDPDSTEYNPSLPAISHGHHQVPVGMWHQYGRIPTGSSGVFLEVSDVPKSWQLYFDDDNDQERADLTGIRVTSSLGDLVGMSTQRKRLGELAESKMISEGVVAVPYVEKENIKYFFKLPKEEAIRYVKRGVYSRGGPIGKSIRDQIDKMKKYIFPPIMDFVRYPDLVEPIAMYIFEFEQNLTKQDLSDIWQNVMPDISVTMKEAISTISHPLVKSELMGHSSDELKATVDNEIRWMLFKVKKEAGKYYYDKVTSKDASKKSILLGPMANQNFENFAVNDTILSKYSHNWPYDYFSLVELVKLDASVQISKMEDKEEGDEKLLVPMPIKSSIGEVSTKELINPKLDLSKDVSPAKRQRTQRRRVRRPNRRNNSED